MSWRFLKGPGLLQRKMLGLGLGFCFGGDPGLGFTSLQQLLLGTRPTHWAFLVTADRPQQHCALVHSSVKWVQKQFSRSACVLMC